MMKFYTLSFLCFILVFLLDQIVKIIILNCASISNPILTTEFIDLVLVFNKGVAFSLGSSFGGYLRWFILILLIMVSIYCIKNKDFFMQYYCYIGFIIGAGFSNLVDRFIYDGVVDYIFWHYGFNFAIFNLADMTINVSIFLIFLSEMKNTNLYKKIINNIRI